MGLVTLSLGATLNFSRRQLTVDSHATNDAGQTVYVDEYFNRAGLTYSTSGTLGTEGTHYYRTTNAYDNRGRHSKTVRGDGTIYRTVFDGLGRPVSEWIGDNDTPASGYWSPTNPADMVKMKEYAYDSGGIGDSHLTGITDVLGRSTALSYDFRGRLLSTTLPDPDGPPDGLGGGLLTSPIYSQTYDNLGRVLTETDPLSNVTSYAYDLAARTVTTTLPDSDAGGSLTSPVIVSTSDARAATSSAPRTRWATSPPMPTTAWAAW